MRCHGGRDFFILGREYAVSSNSRTRAPNAWTIDAICTPVLPLPTIIEDSTRSTSTRRYDRS
jgi:hypothetical protein